MGSRFEADLGDVRLPYEVEQKVAQQIADVVKKALASADTRGDAVTRLRVPDLTSRFPLDHTLGIWVPPDDILRRG